jgi:hypothetical protein
VHRIGPHVQLDQDTGKVLWDIELGDKASGFPITSAAQGRQFLAVTTGSNLHTAQFAALAKGGPVGARNRLIVFALPAAATSR